MNHIRSVPQHPGMKRLLTLTALELQLDRKSVERVVEHFLATLRDEVWANGRLLVPRLGTFRVKKRKVRAVLLPHAPELACIVPEHERVTFSASKNWKAH